MVGEVSNRKDYKNGYIKFDEDNEFWKITEISLGWISIPIFD